MCALLTGVQTCSLPILLAFSGLTLFLGETKNANRVRLDAFGFAMLALGIGSLQLMLDRGQQLDLFSSTEIMVECALSVLFFYLFVVHTLTAKNPFIDKIGRESGRDKVGRTV